MKLIFMYIYINNGHNDVLKTKTKKKGENSSVTLSLETFVNRMCACCRRYLSSYLHS